MLQQAASPCMALGSSTLAGTAQRRCQQPLHHRGLATSSQLNGV